jgi:hypothetical protein
MPSDTASGEKPVGGPAALTLSGATDIASSSSLFEIGESLI